jgi:signal transduction histidine kinase
MGYDGLETPTREDLAIISSIADHIGVSIENERLRRQSEQLAVLEERDRLSRDLHDSATQSLFSLTLFAAAAREYLQNGQLDLVNSQLEELQETAVQTHKEMRLLIYELRPKILEDLGLEEALRQRMQLVEFRSGVQSKINADLSATLPIPVQEVLFQVANEALNNTLKHSGADFVSIDIQMDNGQVDMRIKDNGLGFSTDDTDFSAGLGLDIMRERIQAMNGTFHYDSQPHLGTTIKASIPLQIEHVSRDS